MPRRLRLVPALAVAGILAATGAPRADEWRADASVVETLRYDDNIGLGAASPTSVWGSITSPRLNLSFTRRALELGLDARLDFARFVAEPPLDSNDQQARLSARYDMPRNHWAVAGEVVRDTSRSSEPDDTGRAILDNVRRRSLRLQPSWAYRATRRDELGLDADLEDVSFESGRLTGFRHYQGRATWSRRLARTTTLDGSIIGSRFEPDAGPAGAIDGLAAQAGIAHAVSPRWRMRVAAGARHTRAEAGAESIGLLLDAGTTYKPNARTMLTGSIGRALMPSASGALVERDAAGVSVEYRWRRSIDLALSLDYRRQKSAGGNDARIEPARSSLRVEPGLTWRLTGDWGLRLSYAYRRQELDRDGAGSGAAVSNSVNVTVTYDSAAWSGLF